MDPRAMRAAMKKMGVQQEDIPAVEVIIRTQDKEIVFSNPQVAKVSMMGQVSYQLSGEPHERALQTEISEEDVKQVAQQAGVSEEEARKALEESQGDLAAAIMSFSQ